MATAKKSVPKQSTTKKAPIKKTVHKKNSVKKAPKQEMRSFKLAKDEPPFRSFRISRQTVYWVILVCFIIFAQLWIIKLQIDVANLIELQQSGLQNN